jgi:FkbM family methyltransferase
MNKFYGQLEQDKFLFEKYFSDKKNGISIECGAFDGLMESATYFFEENMGWTCINIEASPPIFNMLEQNRPNAHNFNLGLSDVETELIFKHVVHPYHGEKFGNGSFSHKKEHEDLLRQENCIFDEYKVLCKTYKNLIDNFMDTNFPNKEIDLFVLDVEGFEMEVLRGMKDSKFLPKIMCIEFPHVGLETLKVIMSDMGYIFDTIKDANAIFIKK